jgi:hypothetical protein
VSLSLFCPHLFVQFANLKLGYADAPKFRRFLLSMGKIITLLKIFGDFGTQTRPHTSSDASSVSRGTPWTRLVSQFANISGIYRNKPIQFNGWRR